MSDAIADPRYPGGTGWLVGYVLGAGIGLVVWTITREVTLGIVALAATAPVLGFALEHAVDTRPLSETRRRYLRLLVIAGVVVGALVLLIALFA